MKTHNFYPMESQITEWTPTEYALQASLLGLEAEYRDLNDPDAPASRKRYLKAIAKEGNRLITRLERKGAIVGALPWDDDYGRA